MMQSAPEVTHCGEAFSLSIYCLCKSYTVNIGFPIAFQVSVITLWLYWRDRSLQICAFHHKQIKKKYESYDALNRKRLMVAKVVFPLGKEVDAWRMLSA